MQKENTIISKGKYAHRQPAQLIALRQYIFVRNEGKKKQLLLRFANERNERCDSFSFVLYQLDAKGSVIKEDLFETASKHEPGASFAFDKKVYVEERCTDFRVRVMQAVFGDYIYQVEDAGVLVGYGKVKEMSADSATGKKNQASQSVRKRTIKRPWLCVGVALCVLALIFGVFGVLLNQFMKDRNTFTLSGVKYEFVDRDDPASGVIITGYKGISGSLLLPAEIEGYPVLEIRESAFAGNRRVRRVRVEGLSIPDYAFQDCYNLEHLEVDYVSKIGKRAFFNCDALESVELEGVTALGSYAFASCDRLQSIKISHKNDAAMLELDTYAFADCISLSEVSIDQWILYPQEYNVFSGDTSMSKLHLRNFHYTLPEVQDQGMQQGQLISLFAKNTTQEMRYLSQVSIDYMDEIAPEFCKGFFALKSFSLGSSEISTVSASAFQDCYSLSEINLVKPATVIGGKAFSNTALTTFDTAALSVIGDSAFEGCSSLSGLGIGDKHVLSQIGARAFADCTSLASFYVPLSVTALPESAFDGCSGLASVTFAPGSTLTTIPASCFAGCSSLQIITLPGSIRNIERSAFSGCTQLMRVNATLIENYGYKAFAGCSALVSVPMEEGLLEIGAYAFSATALPTVYVPDTVQKIGIGAFEQCAKLTDLSVHFLGETPNAAEPTFAFFFGESSRGTTGLVPESLQSVTLRGEYASLPAYAFYGCSGVQSFVLSDKLVSIGDYAFGGCSSMTDFDLSTLAFVGAGSFSGTGLQQVSIPAGMRDIPASLFENCAALTSVTFHQELSRIGDRAFAGCTSLGAVALPDSLQSLAQGLFSGCTALSEVTLPAGLAIVGNSAFEKCTALTSLSLPDTVSTLEANAFAESGLTSFTVPGTVTMIGERAFAGCVNLSDLTVPFVGTSANTNSTLGILFGVMNEELPESLKQLTVAGRDGVTIGYGALGNCYHIEEVVLGDGVTGILDEAFRDCYALSFLSLPETLESINGYSTFYGCYRLYEVENLSNVNLAYETGYITDYALEIRTEVAPRALRVSSGAFEFAKFSGEWYLVSYDESVTSLTLPSDAAYNGSSIQWSIPGYFFYENRTVSSVTFSSKVVRIGECAFYRSAIQTLSMKNATALVTISASAFEANSNLTTVELPPYLRTIESCAFYNCVNLSAVKLPSSLQEIGSDAFYACHGLYDVFYNGSKLSLKAGSKDHGFVARYAVAVHRNMSDSLSTEISLLNDTLRMRYFGNQGLILSYYGTVAELDLSSLYSSITNLRIAEGAFQHNSELKKLTFGPSVTQVQSGAFQRCYNLQEVQMQSAYLSEIEPSTFAYCSALRVITLPSTVTVIGDDAFRNCEVLKSFTMPSSLQSIGSGAFEFCRKLLTLTLPANLSEIGYNAFSGCSQLFEVYDLSNHITLSKGGDEYGSVAKFAKLIHTSANPSNKLYIQERDGFVFVQAGNTWYLYDYVGDVTVGILKIPGVGTNVTVLHSALRNLNVAALVIPVSLKKFESNALNGCGKISTIYYDGTEAQWQNVSLSFTAKAVYYYDTCVHDDDSWTYVDGTPTTARCELEWAVTEKATCYKTGTEKGTCVCGCGYYETKDIPSPTEHEYKDGVCVHCNDPEPKDPEDEEE